MGELFVQLFVFFQSGRNLFCFLSFRQKTFCFHLVMLETVLFPFSHAVKFFVSFVIQGNFVFFQS